MSRVRARLQITTIAAAVLCAVQALPASAASPADQFDAPIFGTTATLAANVMPSVSEITCTAGACATGVIPAPAIIDSTRYFSTTVSPGGMFATAPGFQAKLMRSWVHSDEESQAQFQIALIEFAPGTDLAATIAAEAASGGVTLSSPTQVNGMTTWTSSEGEAPDAAFTDRYTYSIHDNTIVSGRCVMSSDLREAGMCALQNMAGLATAAAAKPIPTSMTMNKATTALLPATPKTMHGVVLSQQLASDLLPVANPGLTASPAVARQLVGKPSLDVQYTVKADPSLYVIAQIAPVDTAASRAALGAGCSSATESSKCTSIKMRGTGRGYVERWALATDPANVVLVGGKWNGSDRWLSMTCNLTSWAPLTGKQVGACTSAINALAAAIRQG